MHAVKSIFLIGLVWLLVLTLGCGGSEVDKARELNDSRMFAQAIELLRQRIKAKPEDADAHFLLGVALINTGQFNEAEQSFATAIRLQSNYGKLTGREYKKAGDFALQEGNTAKAFALFEAAVRAQPDLKPAVARRVYMKGKDLSLAGKNAQAIELHQYAVAIDPLLGLELGQWYTVKAINAESASERANLLQMAIQFKVAYEKGLNKAKQATVMDEAEKTAASIRAKMKHVIEQRLDERAWERLALKGIKALGADETVQWSVKYYAQAGFAIKRVTLKDKEWQTIGRVANQSHMFFLSAQDFWYLKSSAKKPQNIGAAITKAIGIQFRGDEYMDIAIKTDSPTTEVFYWVSPRR